MAGAESCLLAIRDHGRGQSSQQSFIGIAVGSGDSRRRRLELKPRQQRFILRMVGSSMHRDRIGRFRESLDRIRDFEIVLTMPIQRIPPWRYTMYSITADKRIIDRLG